MKIEVVLSHVWAHPENVTGQISLGKWHIHENCGCLYARVEVSAWQLWDVRVELLYMLHKLRYADALGLLEHVHDVVLLLLSRVVGKHSEKVEHKAIIK
jgi:hypothetical protein